MFGSSTNLKEINGHFEGEIKEFTVSAVLENEDYLHRWYLGLEGNTDKSGEDFAKRLDEILQKNNKSYKVARNKALKSIETKLVPAKLFQQWTEETKQKGGAGENSESDEGRGV